MRKKHLVYALLVLISACSKKDITRNSVLLKDESKQQAVALTAEEAYTATGALAVATTIITDNNGKNLYKIYYPAQLNAVYPAITWGNGTGALPKDYDNVLMHLASWGFVVIDNYIRQAGSGKEIVGAANYLIAQNAATGSLFYNKIDTAHIGAAGHSQGAQGVINAHTNFASGKNIKAIVPIALPSGDYDTKLVKSSIFFLSGTKDQFISPFSVNKKAYDNVKPGIPAAMGMRLGADHIAIQTGNTEYGYLTAWLCYRLKNDAVAGTAFLPGGEFLNNANWKSKAVKSIN